MGCGLRRDRDWFDRRRFDSFEGMCMVGPAGQNRMGMTHRCDQCNGMHDGRYVPNRCPWCPFRCTHCKRDIISFTPAWLQQNIQHPGLTLCYDCRENYDASETAQTFYGFVLLTGGVIALSFLSKLCG